MFAFKTSLRSLKTLGQNYCILYQDKSTVMYCRMQVCKYWTGPIEKPQPRFDSKLLLISYFVTSVSGDALTSAQRANEVVECYQRKRRASYTAVVSIPSNERSELTEQPSCLGFLYWICQFLALIEPFNITWMVSG